MTRKLHVPFNKSIQFHYWNPEYLNVVEFQSMHWEMETVFSDNNSEYHLYIHSLGVQHVLHHPELYIGSDYEYSGQNYVNNMERQGRWADNVIIQMQISPLSQLNPVNTDRQTTNIYIGHIQECHCMSTMPVLNSNTYEMTCGNEAIKKISKFK